MPDQQNAAESLAGSQRAKAPDDTRPRVLLVDDQPARLLTYEALLEGVGVQCVRALSGREALERLLHQTFALILLDVSMPEMDGFETARLIREHPRFEHTPIIFVTGVHVSALDTLKGYEVGAIDYISVPIVPEILRSKVALLVELYRRRTQLEQLSHPPQHQSGMLPRLFRDWRCCVPMELRGPRTKRLPCELLKGSGATVQVANNGRAGVALARSLEPAVVLLDIGMPGMDGYETCRLLRHDHQADIEIVALTGWRQARRRT